jgi:hypothetical protein
MMRITETKLRSLIRGVIREFTSSATATGAKKGGYESSDTRSKKSDYDTKKSTADTKQTTYTTKKSELDALASKKYRKSHRGRYLYSSTLQKGYLLNPDWTSKNSEVDSAETDRDTANTDRDTAKTNWDTAKEADLQKTIPTQKPPTGGGRGGAQFGKGKTAGKASKKGKKKK